MARRDPNDLDRKKSAKQAPDVAHEQDQEEVVEQQPERERSRDERQDQLGNQGVADLFGLGGVTPGEAGLGIDTSELARQLSAGPQLGGDDPPVDGPLTIEDLVRSWNPGTRRGQDSALPEDPAASDPLPPEDEELLAAVRRDPRRPELPAATGVDGLLQPSSAAVRFDFAPTARAAIRLSTASLAHRSWARLIAPPVASLQDPHGRLVVARVRAAALATLLVADGPAAAGTGPAAVAAFCLDLAGRGDAVAAAVAHVRAGASSLPVAREVLAASLRVRSRRVVPTPMAESAAAQLRETIDDLLDVPSTEVLLPTFSSGEVAETTDDPLGLDDVIAGWTGGKPDPEQGAYDAALQAAERMAGAAGRLRVQAAGVLLAVARTCDQWSSGAPDENLLWVAEQVDAEVAKTLQLLVEIARAIQRRAVPLPGIRNGLRRATRGLDAARDLVPTLLIPIVGAVLPGTAEGLGYPCLTPDDPLRAAWLDGRPADALPWLRATAQGLDGEAAVAFTEAAAGGPSVERLRGVAREAARQDRVALELAAELVAGVAAARVGDAAVARACAEALVVGARARRNGVLLAAAEMLKLELAATAGAPDPTLHYEATWWCWHLGSRAALTLLLRYDPPESDA